MRQLALRRLSNLVAILADNDLNVGMRRDVGKVFPGEIVGPVFVKAVKGPLPQASLMPTGGVSMENVGKWIEAGAVAVGVGGNLTAGAKTGDCASITKLAKD